MQIRTYKPGMKIETGFVRGVPDESYHQGPGYSSSNLKDIIRAPAYMEAHKGKSLKSTDALRIGGEYHLLIFQEDVFDSKFFRVGKRRKDNKFPRRGSSEWHELEATQGKTGIRGDEWDQLYAMRDALEKNKDGWALLQRADGDPELTGYYFDDEYKILRKIKMDFIIPALVILDLKTTVDARYFAYHRQAEKLKYDLSMAYYHDTAKLIAKFLGHEFPDIDIAFLAQEKEVPYLSKLWIPDALFKSRGRRTYIESLEKIRDCRKAGEWAGYDQMSTLSLPDYVIKREMDEHHNFHFDNGIGA